MIRSRSILFLQKVENQNVHIPWHSFVLHFLKLRLKNPAVQGAYQPDLNTNAIEDTYTIEDA